MLLFFALTGCYQFHVSEDLTLDNVGFDPKPVIVEASFRPGDFGKSGNDLYDFGTMIFKITAPSDVTVAIGGITSLIERRDHGGPDAFFPSQARDFFEECGLYVPGSVVPPFVADAPGPYALGFRGSIAGLVNETVLELRILCSLQENTTEQTADLALDIPGDSGIIIVATRDDGTKLARLTEIEYRTADRNFPNPTWFVHYR